MAEANKCDVTGCGEFSEGSPAGRFIVESDSKGMCQKHTDMLIASYFPDMAKKPEPEPEAAPAPEVVATGEGGGSEPSTA